MGPKLDKNTNDKKMKQKRDEGEISRWNKWRSEILYEKRRVIYVD
jgi:hypothetical protein